VARGATLALKITGDARDGVRALDDAEGATSRFGGVVGKMGGLAAAGIATAVGGLAVLGKAAFDAASDLQQSTGAINAVFGDWAIDIEQSAQKAADAVGLSTSAYENLAAVLGAQLKGAGMNIGDVTAKTQDLIGKGADLAATFGGTTADAVSALSSVLKGETDPIERYGVSIKQSDINARLASLGQDKLTGSALKTATANAALGLVMEQTKDSTGAFAKEGDTAAGASARLSALWENMKAKLGEKLLPVVTKFINFIKDDLVPWFDKLTEKGGSVNKFLTDLGTFVKNDVLPVLKDLGQWAKDNLLPVFSDIGSFISDKVVPAFRTIWDFVKTYVIPAFKNELGPAIQGARDAFKTIGEKIDENKDKFQAIYDKMQPFFAFVRDKLAPFLGGALKVAFQTVGDVIGAVVDDIAWILDKGATVMNWIFGSPGRAMKPVGHGPTAAAPGMFGAAPGAALRGAAPGLFGAASSSAGGGGAVIAAGDTYNITIQGALDPVAVADQVAALLDRRARRIGITVAGARA